MAVVNSPYIGIARGRLGEGVFSRVKGQTTIRGYNPSPANPRTSLQQSQRSLFSSAVRFFSRGVQNFFKFAFENKSERESDYNAFMRYNSNRGIYFGPQQNQDDTYPAVGRFIMTKGSLPEIDTALFGQDRDTVSAVINAFVPTTLPTTLGKLSEGLVAAGYQQGDIVTFLAINTDWLPGSASEPAVYGGNPPVWDIRQFTIDTASQVGLATIGIHTVTANGKWYIDMNQQIDTGNVSAYNVCVSRPSNAGLKVSTSVLQLSTGGQMCLIYGQSPQWKALVLEAWRVQDASILQGSRSVNKAAGQSNNVVIDGSLPMTLTAGNYVDFYFAEPVTLQEIVNHLVIVDGDGVIAAMSVSGEHIDIDWPNTGCEGGITIDANDPTVAQLELSGASNTLVIQSVSWS